MTIDEWKNVYIELLSLQLVFLEIYNTRPFSNLKNEKYLLKIMVDTKEIISGNQEIRDLLFQNRGQYYIDYMENKGYFVITSYNRYTSYLLRKIKNKINSPWC